MEILSKAKIREETLESGSRCHLNIAGPNCSLVPSKVLVGEGSLEIEENKFHCLARKFIE